MESTDDVRFVAMVTEGDKALLLEIPRGDGDTSMSATIRRLIRQEAERRGIKVDEVKENATH